jgi:predicted nucleic acid-binding protein
VQAVFADTFYWIAVTNTDDLIHQQALSLSRTMRPDRLVTTEEVLDEYLAYFSGARRSVREHAGNVIASLIDNRKITVVPQSHDSFMAGLKLYRARPDKGYSLTDCISMETMRREGLTDVLTNDRHFEQEGFRAIFREA